ncbi:MAG TPA: phospholipase D-like domain-containing protein, partial [bacterium]|nr:phospholipase D-like domain-containing protein [bacterium]
MAGGRYYDSLIDDLQNAEKDIFVFMYLIRYAEIPYHPVNKLVKELISAKERGLNVTVYLDDHIKEGTERTAVNLTVYDLLKRRGINVKMDRGKKIYHSKVVIIDNNIVYCGSHNWTAAAFNMNSESS